METPKRINYDNLRTAITPPAKEEKPVAIVRASDLIKVGGLYRIRDNYEAVWRMEAGEDGKRYIVRADGEAEAPERLRIAEDSDASNTPKAASALGYKVIHAGSVYVAWECEECATPNLTKFGSVYECDECHIRYADVLQRDEAAPQQTFTRAEVTAINPAFGKRMAELGLRIAHRSLLQVWEKEAKHNVCLKCGREYNGSECPCKSKSGAKAVNPWAVCHESVGPEKSDKFERCVKDVKKKHPIKKD